MRSPSSREPSRGSGPLRMAVLVLAAAGLHGRGFAEGEARGPLRVRDCLWVWGNPEMAAPGPHSHGTFAGAGPAERARLLGVPNVVLAGRGLPADEVEARRILGDAAGAPRLVWEVAPDGGEGPPFAYEKKLALLERLRREDRRIEGVLLDDLSTVAIDVGLLPQHVRRVRELLPGGGAEVKLWGVLYTMSLGRERIDDYVRELDGIQLWVWHAKDFPRLEEDVERCEERFPGKPLVLGIYLHDYGGGRRMPLDLLARQCGTALELLRAGRVEGIVFLTITDDADAVRWTADWVLRTGDLEVEPPVRGAWRRLAIGDGSEWTSVAGEWKDAGQGEIAGSRRGDGAGLQGYSFAFHEPAAYSDLEAELTVSMPTNHADLGLVVRAQDPTRFCLIHFPQGGQSYRAQHFWAALSVADGSGYLRLVKLAHVQRVASNPFGLRHRARVRVAGDRFQVWLNGHPALDARDGTYASGRVGLAGFHRFEHGRVRVRGREAPAPAWREDIEPAKNWSVPFPEVSGQQGGAGLTLTPRGDVLCTFSSGERRYLARSRDKGRTWETKDLPASLSSITPSDRYYAASIHLLRDGRLVAIAVGTGGGGWSESADDGETWSPPAPISTAGWPANPEQISTGWQLELRDGALVRFGLGRDATSTEPVTRWGAVHVRAFSIRSTDGGRTWSAPVSLDGDREDMGNLDLTEATGFETGDGRILCLVRPIYSPWMWETWSHDGGRSWTPCVRGPFPGYAPSAFLKTRSGTALIATRFPGLTIHATRDDGRTWDEGTYIDTSIWAMGSMLEVAPDVVLFVYMDSWGGPLRAQHIRVAPGGLEPAKAGDVGR
ncbi:MAG: exo-alpha-sialidase [Planctomycetes bacterium]|nr:exo-alpha-sialidase [Planctomycetota bacterium]